MARQLFKAVLPVGVSLVVSGCALSNPASYFSDDMSFSQQAATAPVQERAITVVPTPRPAADVTASIIPAPAPGSIKPVAWEQAYQDYEHRAGLYWNSVAEKRRQRNAKRRSGTAILLTDYVLTQPPVYDGPPRPATPPSVKPPVKRKPIPGIYDFLAAAKHVYGFVPDRPHTESEFMRAYAAAAMEAGLTHSQLIALYAFETGGNGTHDLQSGMLHSKDATPISTAIGYNQLVATASVSVMSEFGLTIAAGLRKQAHYENTGRRRQLLKKAVIVEKMTARARTVPHKWQAQAAMAKTPAGLGIHAMTLDKDVGPLLQIHKLRTSVRFLHANGVRHHLSGSEFEMLNLTGDGNGLDMVSMPEEYRSKVPTANFFLRSGYERNPVARQNNTVARLLSATDDKIQQNMQKDGAQALSQAFQALARN